MNLKKHMIAAAMTALLTTPAWAEKAPAPAHPSLNMSQQQEQMNKVKVIDEAVRALEQTNHALQLLDQGKKKQALDTLAMVIGKLELITTQHPDLALAPVDVNMIVRDYVGDADTVKSISEKAQDLLDDGQLQAARHLIQDVASEIDIRTTNLPLKTYPDLIKAVVPLVDQGHIAKAKAMLQRSLSTVVVVDDIIPLPILRAQTALDEAKKMANDKKHDPKLLAHLLKEARHQLQWAQTLGYAHHSNFDKLYDTISELEKKTAAGGKEQGLFDKLKAKIEHLIQDNHATK